MVSPTMMLIMSTFVTCFGSSFLIGYNMGIINLPVNNIKAFLNSNLHWGLDDSVYYSFVSGIFVFFAAIGAFSCGYVADYFGRRNSLIANNLIGIAGSLIAAPCVYFNSPTLLFVGRAITGINSGITIGVASIYLTEIAPQNKRGMIGACHQLALTTGIFVSYLVTMTQINTPELWSIGIGLGAITPIISCLIFPFCPESARYLYLLRHREGDARIAFQRLNSTEDVDMFIAEMRGEVDAAKQQPKFKFIQLFKQRDLRMPVLIAVLIQMLQQLSGINAVIANSSTMLEAARVDSEQIPYFVISYGLVNVICTIVSLPLLEYAGRRTLLLWPTLCLGITLLFMTTFVKITDAMPLENKMPFATVSAVLIYVYIIGFAIGLGPIPALIVSEIFRQGPRGAAYSLSQSIQWLCNFMVLCSFPPLNDILGGYVYLIFFGIVSVCWVFFFLFMPETKNRSFDEVARDLAFGTIVVGKRTAALHSPVFIKNSDNERSRLEPIENVL